MISLSTRAAAAPTPPVQPLLWLQLGFYFCTPNQRASVYFDNKRVDMDMAWDRRSRTSNGRQMCEIYGLTDASERASKVTLKLMEIYGYFSSLL